MRFLYNRLGYLYFVLSGKKPWSFGYSAYKQICLEKIIASGNFDADSLASGYGFRVDERIIEYPWFLSRLPAGDGRLLDAGSILNYDYLLSLKQISEKKIYISTLSPEQNCFWKKGISYIFEDLRNSCYRDDLFDWIVSISTIEHIGLDNTMLYTDDVSKRENSAESYLLAIREFKRILKPGGTLYLSMPFGKRVNHGWFQVFDANMIDQIIEKFTPASVAEKHFKYEADGWHVSSRELSSDATCFDIHRQKTHDADFAAFSRGIVCIEMVK
jgi:SAM-dependent methyltransferase